MKRHGFGLGSDVRDGLGKDRSPMGVAAQRPSHDVPTGRAAPVGLCSGVQSVWCATRPEAAKGVADLLTRQALGFESRLARPAKPVPSRLAHPIPCESVGQGSRRQDKDADPPARLRRMKTRVGRARAAEPWPPFPHRREFLWARQRVQRCRASIPLGGGSRIAGRACFGKWKQRCHLHRSARRLLPAPAPGEAAADGQKSGSPRSDAGRGCLFPVSPGPVCPVNAAGRADL